jgi:formate hydrogenlyase subunit 3/multisubunit Na+/H+ antiporter MnhD subunit
MDLPILIGFAAVVLVLGIIGLMFTPQGLKPFVALGAIIVISILTSIPAISAIFGNPITDIYHLSGAFSDVTVKIDALSAWFILIINLTVINGTLFGIGYLKTYQHLKTNLAIHWVFLTIFHSSMLWVCMFEHGLAFLVAWEIMSLSSLVLVIFEYQKKEVLKAGVNYMIQMHVSVALLTVGFIWLYVVTGSFNFASLTAFFSTNGSIWLLVLLLAGFAIKAGFIPFHSWLPHAHPAAPSHVSGIMSGVIVKLGIYGILRVLSNIQSDYIIIGEVILIVSVITAIYGIANAAVKYDYKRMLAYCTIENIGIIGIGIGLGLMGIGYNSKPLIVLGFSGALLHTLNHSLFKSLLFFSAGSIYQQTHTRNMDRLGGLIKRMPQTAIFFLIGALAIGGLPPFNGFISEFMIYSGLVKGLTLGNMSQLILFVLSIAGLAIVGGMSLLTFTKSFGVIFTGSPRQKPEHEPKEVSLIMRLPQFIIVGVMLSVAIFPSIYYTSVSNIVASTFPLSFVGTPVEIPMSTTISIIGLACLLFIIILASVFALRWILSHKRPTSVENTWGCAYTGSVPRAQYTGLSFTRSFADLLSFLVIEKKNYHKIVKTEIFPRKRTFSSYYFDLLEHYVIAPLTSRLNYSMNYFQFIQNGKIQAYVLYGILFIILIFLCTIFSWI